MKRSKSGAQKRKEAATARDAVAKLPKMTDFFKITEQSRPGTSTERDEENYSVQEKEDGPYVLSGGPLIFTFSFF